MKDPAAHPIWWTDLDETWFQETRRPDKQVLKHSCVKAQTWYEARAKLSVKADEPNPVPLEEVAGKHLKSCLKVLEA